MPRLLEAPERPFEFKPHHYDRTSRSRSSRPISPRCWRGKRSGIETAAYRSTGFIDSIYFRDRGYVIELTAKRDNHEREMDPRANDARSKLAQWQSAKNR